MIPEHHIGDRSCHENIGSLAEYSLTEQLHGWYSLTVVGAPQTSVAGAGLVSSGEETGSSSKRASAGFFRR